MEVRDIGEFNLVERILKAITPAAGVGGRCVERRARLVVGPGDDAFAAEVSPGFAIVGTKDLLVEDIHFRRDWASPEEIGYKSMAVNASDLAAMGGCAPLYALVGLALPAGTDVDFVKRLYRGMNRCCKRYCFSLAGGDTVSSLRGIIISVTMLGAAKKKYILTRSGARPGDLVAVTGTFGDSGAGLHLLQKGGKGDSPDGRYLIRKHLLPEPRFAEAAALARSGAATALIDSSDGLAASVGFIAQASGAGARIDLDKIPLSRAWRRVAADGKIAPYRMALAGGEDYELVCTVRAGKFGLLKKRIPSLTAVGVIAGEKKIEYFLNGKKQNIATKGFEHFGRG
ncbi:MAG: thiamine-phosphate kinase [Elusimicrobia bacterium RIFOXYA2_FULL_50_26]|nr:MAG: thiamine-phosphate kinase [Elusimicrobia bacterium RIFOXYA2_FULL_50_26]